MSINTNNDNDAVDDYNNNAGYPQQQTIQLEHQQQQQEQQTPKSTSTSTSSIKDYLESVDKQYFQEIKENAKLKAFTVILDGGEKKIYARRKVTMKEIAEIERKREILRAGEGNALDKANALLDFYWYSAQCHLRETKTGDPMTKRDYERVTFEDFRKVIDACEFIMLYGAPKN